MKFLRNLLGITKLGKENYQGIKEKKGIKSIEEEIKQYQETWLQHVRRMDEIEYQNTQYVINQKGEVTLEARNRDGGDKFIFRTEE
jgi:hypothetical protein